MKEEVKGEEDASARKVLDPSLPANRLIERADERRG